jgi:hypothetical protein
MPDSINTVTAIIALYRISHSLPKFVGIVAPASIANARIDKTLAVISTQLFKRFPIPSDGTERRQEWL